MKYRIALFVALATAVGSAQAELGVQRSSAGIHLMKDF